MIIPPAPFNVDRVVADATLESLRSAGARGYECFALWFGTIHHNHVKIDHMEVPRQESSHVSAGCHVVVDGDELFRMSVLAHQKGRLICAQVHSHPEDAYHSEIDDLAPLISLPGALSLVVPNFAMDPLDVRGWAAFRLLPDGDWDELDGKDSIIVSH